MNNERNYGLSAPVAPVAGNDGLIKTVDPESDISLASQFGEA